MDITVSEVGVETLMCALAQNFIDDHLAYGALQCKSYHSEDRHRMQMSETNDVADV